MRGAYAAGRVRAMLRRSTTGATRRGAAITAAANMATAGLNVATGVLLARLLGPNGRGELAAIVAAPLFVASLATMGLDQSVAYFSARDPSRSRTAGITSLLVAAPVGLALFGGTWAALPYILSSQRPGVMSTSRVYLLFIAAMILGGILPQMLRGLERYVVWNTTRLLPTLAWVALVIVAFVNGLRDPVQLALLAIVVRFVTLPVEVGLSLGYGGGSFRPGSRDEAIQLLRFGLPSIGATLPRMTNLRLDQVLLAAVVEPRSLGLYAVAVSWAGAVHPLLNAIASVTTPRLARGGTGAQAVVATRTVRGSLHLAFGLGTAWLVLTPFLLPIVVGSEYRAAIPLAMALAVAGATDAWGNVLHETSRGLGQPTWPLRAELAGMAVTLVTLWPAVGLWDTNGAAAVSLAAYAVTAGMSVRLIARKLRVDVARLLLPGTK